METNGPLCIVVLVNKLSLSLCGEILTVGPQSIPCAARCVCWRAVLLEDEPGGQPAIALEER